METKTLLAGLIGFFMGGLLVSLAATTFDKPETNMQNSSSSMSQMVETLRDKRGDEYDKAFISQMTAHHQDAVEMANLARDKAKHSELKAMAENINSVQTFEISKLADWQKDWGYPTTDNNPNKMNAASTPGNLSAKSGDEFDKAFLAAMITHHESAVAMAQSASSNAKHKEIKDLARSIIQSQSGEIEMMKTWQVNWRYTGGAPADDDEHSDTAD